MIINFFISIDKDFHTYVQGFVALDTICYKFLSFITHLGDPKALLLISCGVLLVLWRLNKRVQVAYFAGAMLIASVVVVVAKIIIGRTRPLGIIEENGYSFPSGHALVAAVFFPLIIYCFKYYIKNIWLRRIFIASMLIGVILVGLSRLYMGVHYLTDVFGGFVIGALISSITILLMEGNRRSEERG